MIGTHTGALIDDVAREAFERQLSIAEVAREQFESLRNSGAGRGGNALHKTNTTQVREIASPATTPPSPGGECVPQ